jgi:dephospho-CoA kinase
MPGSGKSLVTGVAKDMGIPVLVMGDVVREEARRRGIPPTPENLRSLSIRLREEFGDTVVAERIAERLRALIAQGVNVVVVDGVRSLKEVEVFRSLGRVVVVAVHASPRTRYERLRRRNRPGDPRSWDEFVARDMTELGFGLGDVIALADYMIVNEGRPEQAMSEARRVLEEVASRCRG